MTVPCDPENYVEQEREEQRDARSMTLGGGRVHRNVFTGEESLRPSWCEAEQDERTA